MNRLAAPALLLLVTPLLAVYGTSWWSFIGGPAAAVALHVLQVCVERSVNAAERLPSTDLPQPVPLREAQAA